MILFHQAVICVLFSHLANRKYCSQYNLTYSSNSPWHIAIYLQAEVLHMQMGNSPIWILSCCLNESSSRISTARFLHSSLCLGRYFLTCIAALSHEIASASSTFLQFHVIDICFAARGKRWLFVRLFFLNHFKFQPMIWYLAFRNYICLWAALDAEVRRCVTTCSRSRNTKGYVSSLMSRLWVSCVRRSSPFCPVSLSPQNIRKTKAFDSALTSKSSIPYSILIPTCLPSKNRWDEQWAMA